LTINQAIAVIIYAVNTCKRRVFRTKNIATAPAILAIDQPISIIVDAIIALISSLKTSYEFKTVWIKTIHKTIKIIVIQVIACQQSVFKTIDKIAAIIVPAIYQAVSVIIYAI
jgi:hypothetical protein